jgi:hypothetical protein
MMALLVPLIKLLAIATEALVLSIMNILEQVRDLKNFRATISRISKSFA